MKKLNKNTILAIFISLLVLVSVHLSKSAYKQGYQNEGLFYLGVAVILVIGMAVNLYFDYRRNKNKKL